MPPPFVPGLTLAGRLFSQGVRPLLARAFPGLHYSAARLNGGSDVLGFDTAQSMDHGWGPRLELFLAEADYESWRAVIDERLRQELPRQIDGFPTHFDYHPDGSTLMAITAGPVNHGVEIFSVEGYFGRQLGRNPEEGWQPADWLAVSSQNLRLVTSGRLFYDGLERLEPIRQRLAWYPHDVWLYLMAAQWTRIGQEEAFLGRTGQVGDELGSRLVAARLVRDLIRLCFLQERQYAPYLKWLGSAFAQLSSGPALRPIFHRVFDAPTWQERQAALSQAYEWVAAAHNALGVTEPLAVEVAPYHSRPFLVIRADRFAEALRAAIGDEAVRRLPENVGNVDTFIDSTDVLDRPERLARLRSVWEGE
jgi:hypothetical protein